MTSVFTTTTTLRLVFFSGAGDGLLLLVHSDGKCWLLLQFFFKIAYMKTILRVIVSLTKGYCYNTFFRKLPVCIIDEYIFNMNFLTGGRRSAMPRRVSITSTLQLCLFMHSSKIHTITRRKRTSKCVDERIEERMTEPIQRGHLRESCPTAATHGVTGTRLPPITSASDNHFG